MKLVFYEDAWEDYLYWQSHDRKLLAKINGLIAECMRTPFYRSRKAGTPLTAIVGLVVPANR